MEHMEIVMISFKKNHDTVYLYIYLTESIQ